MTSTMILAVILFFMGCILMGAMLFVLYEKITRIIVAAVEMHASSIISKIIKEAQYTNRTILREYENMSLDLKQVKRSIPNVISHLYDIEKSKMFGSRLKSWRRASQLSINDIYARTGISKSQISCIERGISPSEDERGILERLMDANNKAGLSLDHEPDGDLIDNVKVQLKPDGALEFEKEKNELEV